MNPQQPQAPKKFNLPGGNGAGRILVLIGGVGFVLIVIIILFSVLFGGGNETGQKLLNIAQTQTEIVRIATDAQSKARSGATLNLANTVSLSVTSSQNQITPLIKKYGAKADTKLLGLKHSAKTDQQLEAAIQSNQYDAVFTTVMNGLLKDYQSQLKTAYSSLTKPTDKQALKTAYDGTGLLLGTK
jgi:hypothetical protein